MGNSNNPKVSIVTIVYNRVEYIAQAIESVLQQSYTNIEYIIYDGESTDGTSEVARSYGSKISKYIRAEKIGIAGSMNNAILHATGEYVLFLHADDVLEKHAIERLVGSLKQSSKKWAMGFYKYLNSRNEIIKTDAVREFTFSDMLLRNIVRHQATIVPRSVFETVQFDRKYKYAMDYRFFLAVWEALGPPHVVKEHLTFFRLDGKNLSSNYYASIKDEMQARTDYRRDKREHYKIPFDLIVYYLRVLKIRFYYSWAQHAG